MVRVNGLSQNIFVGFECKFEETEENMEKLQKTRFLQYITVYLGTPQKMKPLIFLINSNS